mgnify:CR=1 FL=1
MTICPFCENPFPAVQTSYGRAELHPCAKCRNPVILKTFEGKQIAEPIAGARDIREDSPPESVGGAVLSVLHKSRYDLPLMRPVAERLKRSVPEDESELLALVANDPILAARVVHLANGEIFGGLERAVDLQEAIDRLGLGRVRGELVGLGDGPVCPAREPLVVEALEQTWKNSVFSAHCAREIAKSSAASNPDALYLAGLLHNVGKFLLLDVMESGSGEAVVAVRGSERLFTDTIKRFHPLVALHLAERWRFPIDVGIAAYAFDTPARVPDEAFEYTTQIVVLADAIARATGYGAPVESGVSLLAHPANRLLRMSDVRIGAIRIDLSDRLREIIPGFGIEAVPAVA